MNALAGWLSRWPVIIGFLILMIFIGMRFAPVQQSLEGPLLDMIWSGEAARERLAELSAAQRRTHFWATVINDTLYPLAYGGLLAGLAARFAPPRWKAPVLIPALIVIVADIAENTVQALALSGTTDLLMLKSILTPLKFGFFLVAALLALGLAVAALIRWLLRRAAAHS